MSDPTVCVENLAKAYRLYQRPWDRLWELLVRTRRHQLFHALQGVSFALNPGEGLGVIGENGAGKSTLLKILAGVVAPSAGQVAVKGKVASILELGAGFHPDFSGRQNILLNAALLGLNSEETQERLPAIIAFSELGEFLDQPVKCYSTGMAMRLAFSIATQVEPEVLIVDEALSVGDGYFQKKCMDRLVAYVKSGRTLVFCSHAMYYVTTFCRRALWLRNGEVAALGPAEEVVREYENFLLAKSEAAAHPVEDEPRPSAARLRCVRLTSREPRYQHRAAWGVEVEWESTNPELGFHLGIGVNRTDGVEVFSFGSHVDGQAPATGRRHYRARLRVPELPLTKGEFTIYVFLLDEAGLFVYDRQILDAAFQVESPFYVFGLFEVEHHWEFDDGPAARPAELEAQDTTAVEEVPS